MQTEDFKLIPWFCMRCLTFKRRVVLMLYRDDPGCFKCPCCGSEAWDGADLPDLGIDDDEEIGIPVDKSPPLTYSILGGSAAGHGGGSKSKGASRKHLMKKPSTMELYKRLANRKSPKPSKEKADIDKIK